jgi:hypothetical protein
VTLLLPKSRVVRDRPWLDHLHGERCIITGLRGTADETIDPAHVGAFKGMKRSDDEALPLIHSLHAEGHRIGEISMWRARMPDWLIREALRAYARQLYAEWKQKEQAA